MGRDVSKSVLASSLSLLVRGLGRPVLQTCQWPVSEAIRHSGLLAGSSFLDVLAGSDRNKKEDKDVHMAASLK